MITVEKKRRAGSQLKSARWSYRGIDMRDLDSRAETGHEKTALHPSADRTEEFVGFWWRVWAATIDAVLFSIVFITPLYLWFGKTVFGVGSELDPGSFFTVLSYVIPAVLVIVFWVKKSATPGKMFIGAQIVDATSGQNPAVRQWIVRYLAFYVSLLPLGLGLWWIGWDARKQSWHDKLANTVVTWVSIK